MKMHIKKTGIQFLNDFEAGQLDIIKWAKANLQKQIAEIENKDTGYLLRDTKNDALHAFKLVLQRDIWKFMLSQFEQREKDIYKTDEE